MSTKKKEDRIKSAQSSSSLRRKSKEGTSGGISSESKIARFNIWPEWSEAEVNNEKWETAIKTKDKDKTKSPQMAQNLFDDPDGRLRLPPTLKAVKWKRAYEYFTKNPVIVDTEEGIHKFDIFTMNEHLFSSETMRWIICQINILWITSERKWLADADNQGQENSYISPDGTYHTWKFWEHIYSLNKVGKGFPQYNPSGKYIVKLFWMGEWRKILIDDSLPFDENDQLLLPLTNLKNELWPILLSKALLKIASLNYGYSSNEMEFGDFSVIHSLTGWIPQKKIVSKEHKSQIWNDFKKLLNHWIFPDGNALLLSTDKNANIAQTDNQQIEQNPEKVETKEAIPKDKSKKEIKDNKQKKEKEKEKNKPEKIPPEGKINLGNPETLILASYTSTYSKLNMLSASKMADHSESLRKIGISQLYSHPVLLNYYRDCPLIKPKSPEVIPAWKLIRPMVKPDVPKANDCIVHNVCNIPSDHKNEENDIKFVEIQSPFLNYKICNTSLSPNTIENIVEDLEDKLRDNGENEIVKSIKEELNKDSELSKSVSVVNRNVSKSTKVQVNSDISNEEDSVKVNPSEAQTNKNIFNNEMTKCWIDIETFYDCFQVFYVYHKTETYRYSENFSDIKLLSHTLLPCTSNTRDSKRSTSTTPSNISGKKTKEALHLKSSRESNTGKATIVLDSNNLYSFDIDSLKSSTNDQKEPMYLFTDNIESTEIIFCLSAFCKWFPSSDVSFFADIHTNRTSPAKDTSNNMEAVYPESDHESSTSDSLKGLFIAEIHSWQHYKVGKCFKRTRTNGTKAISLKFPPGRHCLRIFIQSPNGFHCKLISQNPFQFGNEEKIISLATEVPKRVQHLGLNIISLYNNVIMSFSNPEDRTQNENLFLNLILGFNKSPNFRTSTVKFTQIFNHCLLKIVDKLNKELIKPDMIFALRAINLDFESANMFLSSVNKQNTNSNRNSAKVPVNTAKVDNRKQSSTKSGTNSEVKEEKKAEVLREYSPSELAQIIRLQRLIQGFYVRKVIKARNPQSPYHHRVVTELNKISLLIEQNDVEMGLSILDEMIDHYPQILKYYEMESDKLNHISLKEYSGTSNLQSGNNFGLLFRENFQVHSQNRISGQLLIKLNASAPKCTLSVINNDNMDIFSEKILKRLYLTDLKPNNSGYTLMASVKDSDSIVDWKLKLICDGNDLLPKFSKQELRSDFTISRLRDYYIPDESYLLFQQMVKVTSDHTASIFVKLSNPHVQIRLSIFNFEEELYFVEGIGEAFIQSFIFLKDQYTDDQIEIPGRSQSRASNKSKKHREKLDRHSSKNSRTNSSCSTEDNKINKYSIQAFVSLQNWPLSTAEEEFVEKLKRNKRKDMSENKIVNESPTKLMQNTESSKKEVSGKPQSKSKGKDKSQESSKTVKSNEKLGTKNVFSDSNFSRPNSTHFDFDKPHYVVFIVSDGSSEDNIQIFKNNEKFDNLASIKKVWLEIDPLRFEKGKQIQMKFNEENQMKTESDIDQQSDLEKPKSTPTLDLSVYYPSKNLLSDEDIIDNQQSRYKNIELYRQNLLEWNLWCQNEKTNRMKKITDTLNTCYDRQKIVDSHRLNYFKVRENIRQKYQAVKKEIESN